MLRSTLRQLGVGRWLMANFYQPTAGARWLLSLGAGNAIRLLWGESAMRRAARSLPPTLAPGAGALSCSFMTGQGFWHQTVFCAWSLSRRTPDGIRPEFYDDGSLQPAHQAAFRRVFPHARIVSQAETRERLEEKLPTARFPLLRLSRGKSTMMRKLVDLRIGAPRWQLYLDSDMLFFQRPALLEELGRTQTTAVHMVDHLYAYALPASELAAISGREVLPRVNAGIVGLDDGKIDWREVEAWLARMPERLLTDRLLEQTLTAMLLGTVKSVAAPPADYRILYDSETVPPSAALLHYIYKAKTRYFSREWRRCLRA